MTVTYRDHAGKKRHVGRVSLRRGQHHRGSLDLNPLGGRGSAGYGCTARTHSRGGGRRLPLRQRLALRAALTQWTQG
eukprot:9322501-Pyramimonas_sp.AAC.1